MIAFVLTASVAVIFILYYRSIVISNYNKEIRKITAEEKQINSILEGEMGNNSQLLDKKNKLKDNVVVAEKTGGVPVAVVSYRSAKKKGTPEYSSDWLVKNGKISMEQYSKVYERMKGMSMDFVTTCLTLGFIDKATAAEAKKYKDPVKDAS